MTKAVPAFDWEQVRLFLAVARERSLAAAGARLGLDVSTVSRRLDRLEAELGAPLFDRTREGTTPTALAEQMVSYAEEMEVSAARFASAGAQIETEVEGTVRLTVLPGIADAFVAPRLAALHRKYPKLIVELDASVSYADLTRREADLAIRSMRPTSGELITQKLITVQARPMASARYARELGKLKRLEDARWITWGADLSHLPDAVWLRTHAPTVTPVLRTSHFASQLAAAREGLGIVVASAAYKKQRARRHRSLEDVGRCVGCASDRQLVARRTSRAAQRSARRRGVELRARNDQRGERCEIGLKCRVNRVSRRCRIRSRRLPRNRRAD